MSSILNNKYGSIEIDKNVIAQLVYRAAMESYGIVGLSSKNKGIVELLRGDNATKGVVVVENEDETLDIEIFVIMQYGTNISTIADNIIDSVKYTIEKYLTLKLNSVSVNVQGIRVK